MRYLGLILFVLHMTASAGNAAAGQKFSAAEQEVVNVQKARMEAAARRDMAAWSRYVAEDCIISSDNGSVLTKAQMMAYYKKVPA